MPDPPPVPPREKTHSTPADPLRPLLSRLKGRPPHTADQRRRVEESVQEGVSRAAMGPLPGEADEIIDLPTEVPPPREWEARKDLPDDVAEAAGKPGSNWGKYVLVSELARGGMGIVWKAWDRSLGRFVAIKFLRAGTAEGERRLFREAQLLARLQHPNIATVYEVGMHDNQPFLAMQLIHGQVIDRMDLELHDLLRAIRDVALALDYAHGRGVVHRDVKPGNIMIGPRQGDEPFHAYVMDFGVAREALATSATHTGRVVGTPPYMSPEQVRGNLEELGPRSDIYSLGATLYHLITGRPPFETDDVVHLASRIPTEHPPRPRKIRPTIPPEVEQIVLKAMEKDPPDRYPTAKAFADDIDRFLGGLPILARRPSLPRRCAKWMRRNWKQLAPLAVGLACVVGVVGIGLWDLRNQLAIVEEQWRMVSELEKQPGFERNEDSLQRVRDACQTIIRLSPEHFRARTMLSYVEGLLRSLPEERRRRFATAVRSIEAAWAWLSTADREASPDDCSNAVNQALIESERAVEAAPDLAAAHHLVGECLQRLGRESEALDRWRTAVQLDPSHGPAWASWARSLIFRRLRWKELRRSIRDLVDPSLSWPGEAPEDSAFVTKLTRALPACVFPIAVGKISTEAAAAFLQGDGERARLLATRALGITRPSAPGNEWLHLFAAAAAPEKISIALENRPNFVEALFVRAVTALPTPEGAAQDLDRVIRLRPGLLEPYLCRALLRLGSPAAATDLEQALAKEPSSPVALFCRALHRAARGESEPAIADLGAVLRDPNYWPAYLVRARLLLETDPAAALADVETLLDLQPSCGPAFFRRAEIQRRRGMWKETAEDCKRALELSPEGWRYRPEAEKLLREAESHLSD